MRRRRQGIRRRVFSSVANKRKVITLRARKLYREANVGQLEPVGLLPGMNQPETRVALALTELHIRYEAQANVFGGGQLGGAKLDFMLPDYMIDLEFAGPFHNTSEISARDLLRDVGVAQLGYRLVTLYERDLGNLKPRILELLGTNYAPFNTAVP